MLTATHPYWLSLATTTTLVEVGVSMPDPWRDPVLGLVRWHNEAITPAERLVRCWNIRPALHPLRTAEDLFDEMACRQGMPLAANLRAMAAAIDLQALECAEPQAWQVGYVDSQPGSPHVQASRRPVLHSACVLAPAWRVRVMHEYFRALTSLGHLPPDDTPACYGFCLQRQMDEDFVSPLDVASILKARLTPLLRSMQWGGGGVPWGAIDAFGANMQALGLHSSTAHVDEPIEQRRRL